MYANVQFCITDKLLESLQLTCTYRCMISVPKSIDSELKTKQAGLKLLKFHITIKFHRFMLELYWNIIVT